MCLSAIQHDAREGNAELERSSGIIFYKSTQILAYADDIDIIGLQSTLGIKQAAANLGLQINEAKTKQMVAISANLPITNPNLRRRDVQIDERTFEVVPEFTSVGSKVSSDNSLVVDLQARTLAANRLFYSLS